jgi:hypothetical protein
MWKKIIGLYGALKMPNLPDTWQPMGQPCGMLTPALHLAYVQSTDDVSSTDVDVPPS